MRRTTTALLIAFIAAVPAAADLPAPLDGAEALAARAELALVSSLDSRDEMLEAAASAESDVRAERKPATVLLASLAVPGAGQLMQGHKRGYLYLLAEVALWGGVYALDKKGNDRRDDYESFADANWNDDAYYQWYNDYCVGCDDCGYECRPLAEHGTQEYYEDIGKYNTYWRWWNHDGDETYIEWDDYSDGDVAQRDRYYDMRDESNTYLRQARYALMAVFLNHVASAVDSFLSARGGERNDAETVGDLGLEFDVDDTGEGLRCALVARY